MTFTRRSLLQTGAAAAVLSGLEAKLASAQTLGTPSGVQAEDRVFICNEDSNRLCCTDQGSGRNAPNPVWGQVTRT